MDNNTSLSFQDIISSSIANINSGSIVSIGDIVLALTATLICSIIIIITYRKSYQGVIYQKSFSLSIIMLSLITTSVIMIISGNLILSLGMVGALSIIRFRSAIKDPLDIVYMFWAVAIGISNGIANFKVAFVSSIFIAIVVLILKDRPQKGLSYMLICKYSPHAEEDVLKLIEQKVTRYTLKSKIAKEDQIELILEIYNKDFDIDIPNKLLEITDVQDSTMISYSNNLLDK
jgi:hypothetical protein